MKKIILFFLILFVVSVNHNDIFTFKNNNKINITNDNKTKDSIVKNTSKSVVFGNKPNNVLTVQKQKKSESNINNLGMILGICIFSLTIITIIFSLITVISLKVAASTRCKFCGGKTTHNFELSSNGTFNQHIAKYRAFKNQSNFLLTVDKKESMAVTSEQHQMLQPIPCYDDVYFEIMTLNLGSTVNSRIITLDNIWWMVDFKARRGKCLHCNAKSVSEEDIVIFTSNFVSEASIINAMENNLWKMLELHIKSTSDFYSCSINETSENISSIEDITSIKFRCMNNGDKKIWLTKHIQSQRSTNYLVLSGLKANTVNNQFNSRANLDLCSPDFNGDFITRKRQITSTNTISTKFAYKDEIQSSSPLKKAKISVRDNIVNSEQEILHTSVQQNEDFTKKSDSSSENAEFIDEIDIENSSENNMAQDLSTSDNARDAFALNKESDAYVKINNVDEIIDYSSYIGNAILYGLKLQGTDWIVNNQEIIDFIFNYIFYYKEIFFNFWNVKSEYFENCVIFQIDLNLNTLSFTYIKNGAEYNEINGTSEIIPAATSNESFSLGVKIIINEYDYLELEKQKDVFYKLFNTELI